MFFALTLLGALPATLLFISKLNLGYPPREETLSQISPIKAVRSSREDVRLAA